MSIKRNPVNSSHVRSIGYDPETETMQVEYQNGLVYDYAGVPKDMHDRCCKAPSIGKFLRREIHGLYDYKRR